MSSWRCRHSHQGVSPGQLTVCCRSGCTVTSRLIIIRSTCSHCSYILVIYRIDKLCKCCTDALKGGHWYLVGHDT
jgi:hypothetical protein